MSKYVIIPENATYLMHHGIKGQKWGVRRFQNADGSLKPAGAKRYGYETSEALKPSRAERKAAKQEAKRASINDYKKKKY